jgi:hypothetical protein
LSKAIDDVHASKSDPVRTFSSHLIYTVHTEQKTDEKTTRIEKKLMQIDQKDRHSPNIIIELIKAIGDVHASKSDPVRPISSQGTTIR